MLVPSWIADDSPIADPLGRGENMVRFLRMLRHPKNRAPGRPFQLDPWQERIVRRAYLDHIGQPTKGGHWRFSAGDVLAVSIIRAARGAGVSLEDAAALQAVVYPDVWDLIVGETGGDPLPVIVWRAEASIRDMLSQQPSIDGQRVSLRARSASAFGTSIALPSWRLASRTSTCAASLPGSRRRSSS